MAVATRSCCLLLPPAASAAGSAASAAAADMTAALLPCIWLARRPDSRSNERARGGRRVIMMHSPSCTARPACKCHHPPRLMVTPICCQKRPKRTIPCLSRLVQRELPGPKRCAFENGVSWYLYCKKWMNGWAVHSFFVINQMAPPNVWVGPTEACGDRRGDGSDGRSDCHDDLSDLSD